MAKELEENLQAVRRRVAAACAASGRDPAGVRLVAVTKEVEPPLAHALARLGCLDLGESRVADLERKARWCAGRPPAVRWHFLGHVQRNKARRVVELADEIHSVDSARLLETLSRHAQELGRRPAIWLQIKLTREPAKHGLEPAAVPALVAAARAGPLPLQGLMTMAAPREEEGLHGPPGAVFRALALLAASLPAAAFAGGAPRLDMGMSDDLEEAIRAGAHTIRVGRALFAGVGPGAPAADDAGGER
ncbi:MAG: YggS family pyridoxal phosphate-dependent enzyme [Planctomycetota bacterium]